jgi:hypothetical protein
VPDPLPTLNLPADLRFAVADLEECRKGKHCCTAAAFKLIAPHAAVSGANSALLQRLAMSFRQGEAAFAVD